MPRHGASGANRQRKGGGGGRKTTDGKSGGKGKDKKEKGKGGGRKGGKKDKGIRMNKGPKEALPRLHIDAVMISHLKSVMSEYTHAKKLLEAEDIEGGDDFELDSGDESGDSNDDDDVSDDDDDDSNSGESADEVGHSGQAEVRAFRLAPPSSQALQFLEGCGMPLHRAYEELRKMRGNGLREGLDVLQTFSCLADGIPRTQSSDANEEQFVLESMFGDRFEAAMDTWRITIESDLQSVLIPSAESRPFPYSIEIHFGEDCFYPFSAPSAVIFRDKTNRLPMNTRLYLTLKLQSLARGFVGDASIYSLYEWIISDDVGKFLKSLPASYIQLGQEIPLETAAIPKSESRRTKTSQPVARTSGPLPRYSDLRKNVGVAIVLKEDQSTGRTVNGFVEEVLTAGDHPRGVKAPAARRPIKTPAQIQKIERDSANLLQNFQRQQKSPAYIEMQKQRQELPAFTMKAAIISTIKGNRVTVVSGATGCGKSTQVPQFILDDSIMHLKGGSCNILVTQPRRIAAIGLADRVAAERAERVGESVGYQIRLESKVSDATRLTFCTTGILLRMLEDGAKMDGGGVEGISHIFVDEIHERSLDSDFLLMVLRDMLAIRTDLRLVLMSATLNAELFSSYFGGAPIIHIPGRTFPVQVLFLEDALARTNYRPEGPDYVRKLGGGRRDVGRRPPAEQTSLSPFEDKNVMDEELDFTAVDDVVFVIDAGRMKETRFDPSKGMSSLEECWVSKANATQRRGRAGRVQSGTAVHLFTSYKFETFLDQQPPEIHRSPLEQICLRIKILPFLRGRIDQILSKVIEPPSEDAIRAAVLTLRNLQALSREEDLTPLGFHLGRLPVDVRIGKLILFGSIFRVLDPILTIASAMSIKSPFVAPFEKRDLADERKMAFSTGISDHLTLLTAYNEWQRRRRDGAGAEYRFLFDNFLSGKTLAMIASVKRQLAELLCDIGFVNGNVRTRDMERRGGRFSDGVAEAIGESIDVAPNFELIKALLVSALYPNVVKIALPANGKPVRSPQDLKMFVKGNEEVFIHPSSVNWKVAHYPPMQPFLIYHEKIKTTKVYIRDSSHISNFAIAFFGGRLKWDRKQNQLNVDDGWIRFAATTKTSSIIEASRLALDDLLQMKIENPGLLVSETNLVKAIVSLITTSKR
ncbi:ATPdependent RNA helicase [Irineochytrium annulatum]|nr:ATPdependent RNA helicase [Irineochytrium annulatum]